MKLAFNLWPVWGKNDAMVRMKWWPLCCCLATAMPPEWSARKARVMDAMRASVAKSTRHPLADPQLRLDAREFLVVVGTKDGNGSDVVLMDAPETSCTKKCAEFRDQFVSSLAAAATGRCPGLPRAAPRAAFLVREASVGCADDCNEHGSCDNGVCNCHTVRFMPAPWTITTPGKAGSWARPPSA